jgi:hypothetical protein
MTDVDIPLEDYRCNIFIMFSTLIQLVFPNGLWG